MPRNDIQENPLEKTNEVPQFIGRMAQRIRFIRAQPPKGMVNPQGIRTGEMTFGIRYF